MLDVQRTLEACEGPMLTRLSHMKTFLGNFLKLRPPAFCQDFTNFPNEIIRYIFAKHFDTLVLKYKQQQQSQTAYNANFQVISVKYLQF